MNFVLTSTIDVNGLRRAHLGISDANMLESFLESDAIDEILIDDHISRINTAISCKDNVVGVGNGYEYFFDFARKTVSLRPESIDGAAVMELAVLDFLDALNQWKRILNSATKP